MKIIQLMLINIIILLTSLPATIKVAGRGGRGGGGGGGGFVGGGGGFGGGGFLGGGGDSGGQKRSGGTVPGTKTPIPDGSSSGYKGGNPGGKGTGYRGGIENGKPRGGGDGGAAIVVIPKKPVAVAKMPMPQSCKPEVINCINTHIYGTAAPPPRYGACCNKLRHAVPCVCKFLTSMDPKLSNAANGVLRGCHFSKPNCPKMPMPQECREEVRNCVNIHIYRAAGEPPHRGACCLKLQHSKKCVCKFLTSQDSTLVKPANGVLRGCRFTKTTCPKI